MLVVEAVLAREAASQGYIFAAGASGEPRRRGRPPLNGKLDRDEQRAYIIIGMNAGLREPKSTREWIKHLQAEEEARDLAPSKRLFPRASAIEQLEQSVSRGLAKMKRRTAHPRGDLPQRYMRRRKVSSRKKKLAKKSR